VIARRLRVTDDTVRKWRKRFCHQGLPGLVDRPRSGRPRVFSAAVVAEAKALACELPGEAARRGRVIRTRHAAGIVRAEQECFNVM
jgi:transposase